MGTPKKGISFPEQGMVYQRETTNGYYDPTSIPAAIQQKKNQAKVLRSIKKAKDGVLFIDEAYSLARKDDDNKDFGKEAIEVLLKELSDSTDIAIVVAGYPEEMDVFLESNPGLKSRFVVQYDFPDYTPQELGQIADYASLKRGVELSEKAHVVLNKFLVDRYRDRDKYFGNARLVNSMLDEAKIHLGLRIM